jgi:hypothetical protein
LCFIQQSKTFPKATTLLYLSAEFSFDFLHGCCLLQTVNIKWTVSFHFCALHLRQSINSIKCNTISPCGSSCLSVFEELAHCSWWHKVLLHLPHSAASFVWGALRIPKWSPIFFSSVIGCDKDGFHVWLNSVLLLCTIYPAPFALPLLQEFISIETTIYTVSFFLSTY